MKMTIRLSGLILCSTLFLASCDNFYFHKPQPTDVSSIEEFPDMYRGVWVEETDTIIIGRDFVSVQSYTEQRIPREEIQDNAQYKLVDGLIFVIATSDVPDAGHPYYWDNDTLVYVERDVMEIDLGKRTFLRPVGNGHMINRKDENSWYELYYMESGRKGSVVVRMLKKSELEALPAVKKVYEKESDYFFKVEWSSSDLLNYINSGGFSDTLMYLEPSARIE